MSDNFEKHINRSSEHHTFLARSAVLVLGKNPHDIDANALVNWMDQLKAEATILEHNDVWQTNNLEYDLRSTEWICNKAKASKDYAQGLYAAMCNNSFQKLDVMPILQDQQWNCSWRYAGGIVAHMVEQGDYIDWYCSGHEGQVFDEIREDLKILRWRVIDDQIVNINP